MHQGQVAASEALTLTHDAGLEQVNSAAVSECVGRARRISTSVASAVGRPCYRRGAVWVLSRTGAPGVALAVQEHE